jgi:hypothetical protein
MILTPEISEMSFETKIVCLANILTRRRMQARFNATIILMKRKCILKNIRIVFMLNYY